MNIGDWIDTTLSFIQDNRGKAKWFAIGFVSALAVTLVL